VRSNGFYLSLEAIVSMLLLTALLSHALPKEESSLNDLHVFKKENDLLLLWQLQGQGLNAGQMQLDFEFAFPEQSGKIVFNGEEIIVGKQGGEAIASEIVFFDGGIGRHEIRLIVFKQSFA